MSWLAALKAVAESFTAVFTWTTGGRTKEENAVRDEIERWRREYNAALTAGDVERTNASLRELRRLRDHARSQSD